MRPTELIRCTLACWLDRQRDRLGNLINLIEPASEVWERYDEWCRKRGHYDWLDELPAREVEAQEAEKAIWALPGDGGSKEYRPNNSDR